MEKKAFNVDNKVFKDAKTCKIHDLLIQSTKMKEWSADGFLFQFILDLLEF